MNSCKNNIIIGGRDTLLVSALVKSRHRFVEVRRRQRARFGAAWLCAVVAQVCTLVALRFATADAMSRRSPRAICRRLQQQRLMIIERRKRMVSARWRNKKCKRKSIKVSYVSQLFLNFMNLTYVCKIHSTDSAWSQIDCYRRETCPSKLVGPFL